MDLLEGEQPGECFPAVYDGGATRLQGAVDFFGAVEAGGGGEEDADVGDGVGEVVVGEVEGFGALVGDGDGPGVGLGVGLEDVEEGLVDVCGGDLDVGGWVGGEDEAGYRAGAACVVVDYGAGWDWG